MECVREILRIRVRENQGLQRIRIQAERDIGKTAVDLLLGMLEELVKVDPCCDWSQTEAIIMHQTEKSPLAIRRSDELLNAMEGLRRAMLAADCSMSGYNQKRYNFWFKALARAHASTVC